MRPPSSLLLPLLLLPTILTLDLKNGKGVVFEQMKDMQHEGNVKCKTDIGVAPFDGLRMLRPYYQMFIIDMTVPYETFGEIRNLVVHFACLFSESTNHIKFGYIAIVDKNKVASEPNMPDIRDFIGLFTNSDADLLDKLYFGAGKRTEVPTPLSGCEKAEIIAQIAQKFDRMATKPFRFLIFDDQRQGHEHVGEQCDQAFEFGKALSKRGISLDKFSLDEILVRDQEFDSGKSFVKEPVFTLSTMKKPSEAVEAMRAFITQLTEPGMWENERLKNALKAEEESAALEEEEEEKEDDKDLVLALPGGAADSLAEEKNMTNPVYEEEMRQRVKKMAEEAAMHNTSLATTTPSTAATTTVQEETSSSSSSVATTESTTTAAAAAAAAVPPVPVAVRRNEDDAAAAAESTTRLYGADAAKDMEWWMYLLIALAIVIIAVLLFMIFCCWYEHRKLKTKMLYGVSASSTAVSNQQTPLIGVSRKTSSEQSSSNSTSKRPLKLTNSEFPVTDLPTPQPTIESRNVPDPYSPVKYIPTPVHLPSEVEMTHTEAVPGAPEDAMKQNVVTPMEKMPELHVDEYNN